METNEFLQQALQIITGAAITALTILVGWALKKLNEYLDARTDQVASDRKADELDKAVLAAEAMLPGKTGPEKLRMVSKAMAQKGLPVTRADVEGALATAWPKLGPAAKALEAHRKPSDDEA